MSAPIQSPRPFDLPSAIFRLSGYHMDIDHGPHGGNGVRLCISRIWSNGEIIEILSISLGLKALDRVQSIAQLLNCHREIEDMNKGQEIPSELPKNKEWREQK